MVFYRPRSFLQLVLLGFSLVMLPLIVAVVYATLSVDRLAEQSKQAMYRAVQVHAGSRSLGEYLHDHGTACQTVSDPGGCLLVPGVQGNAPEISAGDLYARICLFASHPQEQQVKHLADREQMLFDALLDNVRNLPQV